MNTEKFLNNNLPLHKVLSPAPDKPKNLKATPNNCEYLTTKELIRAFNEEKKFKDCKINLEWPLNIQIQIISNHL